MKLTTDILYEALTDDERFASLPALLAEATNARRASMNARYVDGHVDVLTCSSFDAAFIRDVVEGGWGTKDPWLIGGLSPENQNQIHFGERFVSPAALERTEFYNELVRAILVLRKQDHGVACPGKGAKLFQRQGRGRAAGGKGCRRFAALGGALSGLAASGQQRGRQQDAAPIAKSAAWRPGFPDGRFTNIIDTITPFDWASTANSACESPHPPFGGCR